MTKQADIPILLHILELNHPVVADRMKGHQSLKDKVAQDGFYSILCKCVEDGTDLYRHLQFHEEYFMKYDYVSLLRFLMRLPKILEQQIDMGCKLITSSFELLDEQHAKESKSLQQQIDDARKDKKAYESGDINRLYRRIRKKKGVWRSVECIRDFLIQNCSKQAITLLHGQSLDYKRCNARKFDKQFGDYDFCLENSMIVEAINSALALTEIQSVGNELDDYPVEKEKYTKAERIVVEYEKERMRKQGLTDNDLTWIYAIDNQAEKGYNVISLDENREDNFILIKIAKNAKSKEFLMSKDEMDVAKELGRLLSVYLVSNLYGKNPHVKDVGNPYRKRSIKKEIAYFKVSMQ